MGETALALLGAAVMLGGLATVPLGLPGNWIMLAVVAAGTLLGRVSPATLAVLGAVVLAAELAEFLLVRAASARYGGSPSDFWGAVAGGLAGVVVGAPVPVAGSLVAGIVGTFAGAAAVALWRTRRPGEAARVGWGALLGRVFSAALKTAAGIAVLVVGGGALFLG